MKRNNLTTAIIAGITGVAGIASVSNAVNLNSDGLGQALVFPYYTVNNGLNTLISVVNTSNEVKAVKVRFLEGKNSRECLDFNLYLSPYDVWTSALIATTSTAAATRSDYANQDSVKIITSDTSCTVPAINNQEFLPWGFDPAGTGAGDYDLGGLNLERCTEGHFEMIEMGVVTNVANNNAAAAATHTAAGSPAACSTLVSNWSETSGVWGATIAGDASLGIDAPTGGLFGSASIIDVETGVDVAYNADALEGYTVNQQHSDPGNLTPNLGTGSSTTSNIFDNGSVRSNTWLSDEVQAVSAVYMHDHIYAEYALIDSIGANTELVVTFPTKFAYVDSATTPFGALNIPFEPFTNEFDGTACEDYSITYWNREELQKENDVTPVRPSPLPPGIISTNPIFCWETNVLELHDAAFDSSLPSAILGSSRVTHFALQASTVPTYFDTGWISLDFSNPTGVVGDVGYLAGNHDTNDNINTDTANADTFVGLPVTGFAIQRYVNATAGNKNYAGLFAHRYSKSIY